MLRQCIQKLNDCETMFTNVLKNQEEIVNMAIQNKFKHIEEAKDFRFEFKDDDQR